MAIYGDIEAPMVIKLKGTGFVIVDGHHTLEAYRGAKRTQLSANGFRGRRERQWIKA
jgi:hypothetical protein